MDPLIYREPLKKSWLDTYGHLNEGYYMVAFGNANWHFCEHMGMGVTYFEQTQCGYYTAEAHIRYLKEVRYPADLEIDASVISIGDKKVRMVQQMRVDGITCASNELVTVHVDMRLGKATPIPESVRDILQTKLMRDLPNWIGKGIVS